MTNDAAMIPDPDGLGQILEDSVNEIFIFDAETMAFVMVNRGARRNLLYTQAELLQLTPVDIKPEYTKERFGVLVGPLRRGSEQKLVFQTVHERKDGSRYDAEIHLQLTQYNGRASYVAIVLDITERLKDQELVRIQQAAIDASSNSIVITDARQPDHPIIFANRAFFTLSGYSEEETLGKNCRFLQGDERDQPERAHMCEAIRGGKAWHGLIRNYRKDGTMFWNELTISPVRDESGELTHFIGIQHDVTKRMQAEGELKKLNQDLDTRVQERTEQLEAAQDQLVRKEKLATLGQLAGSVAHEIRTPLSVIRNAAYYLEASAENPDKETKASFGEINRGLVNADAVFEELLDYARDPTGEFAQFPLSEAIEGALFGLEVPTNVELSRSREVEGPLQCVADCQQISRILRNLLENGIQAMPDGGRMVIACSAKPGEGTVVVSVSDTGAGMTDDQLQKIFEPLFTTKGKGIGLGLALSQRYAALNQGRLEVTSVLGEGSEFTLTLPSPDG